MVKLKVLEGAYPVHTGLAASTLLIDRNQEQHHTSPQGLIRPFQNLPKGDSSLGVAIAQFYPTVAIHHPEEEQEATAADRLPQPSQLPQAGFPLPRAANTPPDLSNINILVVEDNLDTLDFLSFLLEQHGATVTAVSSAREALVQLGQRAYDLLISDIGMPQMDGYTLIRQIRARSPQQGGRIPAIALTAFSGEQDRQRALAAGFQVHLAKPILPNPLIEAILNLL